MRRRSFPDEGSAQTEPWSLLKVLRAAPQRARPLRASPHFSFVSEFFITRYGRHLLRFASGGMDDPMWGIRLITVLTVACTASAMAHADLITRLPTDEN